MLFLIFFIWHAFIAVVAFYFFKTSKQMPKTWYEWKTEFRFQYIGVRGLYDDFRKRHSNKVELYKQPGRVAVITGGNRGIGLRIIEKLLECEMTVVMGVRDPKSAEESVGKIVDLTQTKGKLICEELDVGSLASVKAFGKKVQQNFDKIDILFNNAGIMFAPYSVTEEGFESHFAINYLGHFLLTHILLPQLKAAGTEGHNARIVNVSSVVNLIGRINYKDINAEKSYYPATGYNQSKLAQILFTRYLNTMMDSEKAHVQVHAVHPGVVDTDLFKYSSTTAIPQFKKAFFKTPEEGSRSVVYAAISPKIEGQGGTYLSNCERGPMHPDAKSTEKCKKFFEFSCNLAGIEEYGNGKI